MPPAFVYLVWHPPLLHVHLLPRFIELLLLLHKQHVFKAFMTARAFSLSPNASFLHLNPSPLLVSTLLGKTSLSYLHPHHFPYLNHRSHCISMIYLLQFTVIVSLCFYFLYISANSLREGPLSSWTYIFSTM